MGCCPSTDPPNNNASDPGQERQKNSGLKKLLLLGAGWSGKSTVFKQMKVIYGKGFDEEERKSLRWTIYQNVFQAMKTLCEENKQNKYGINKPEFKKDFDFVRTYEDEGDNIQLDQELGSKIERLWGDPAIRKTYDHRSDFFFANDEVHYFFNNLDSIMKEDYLPSEDDVLRCRWTSTGVKKEVFKIENVDCVLLDVGGQKSERKKWVQCFENVFIVLFVVAISEYDQVMYEDEDSNRVRDALDLFEDICNSKWFCNTNVVLFLNKIDTFKEKVKQVPLKKYFKDFKFDENKGDLAEQAKNFLINEFKGRNHQEREVLLSVTCATDKSNIKAVFDKTVKKILRESKEQSKPNT